MSGFSEVQLFLHDLFKTDAEVAKPEPGAARFGSKGFRVADKVFAMEAEGALAVKLPRDRVVALVGQQDGRALTMGGRTMKEWIVLSDHALWSALAQEARAFVGACDERDR